MWQMRTVVIPIVVGALGVVKKDTDTQISEILGNGKLQEIHNTVLVKQHLS